MTIKTNQEIMAMTENERFLYFLKEEIVETYKMPEDFADKVIEHSNLKNDLEDHERRGFIMHYDVRDWAADLLGVKSEAEPAAGYKLAG